MAERGWTNGDGGVSGESDVVGLSGKSRDPLELDLLCISERAIRNEREKRNAVSSQPSFLLFFVSPLP